MTTNVERLWWRFPKTLQDMFEHKREMWICHSERSPDCFPPKESFGQIGTE